LRRFRRRVVTATAVVVFSLAIAACGEQVVTHVEASSTVHAALTGALTSPTTQFVITAQGLPGETNPVDRDLSVVVTTSRLAGQDSSSSFGNRAVDVSIDSGASTLFDVRYVGMAVYMRADVNELAKYGNPASVEATVRSLDEMAARPGLGYIHALVLGEWVGISASTLKAVSHELAGEIPSAQSSPLNSQRLARLQTSITSSLAQSLRTWLSVHQVSAGEYALSLPVRHFVASFVDSIAQPLETDLNEPFLSEQTLSQAVNQIPANLFVHVNVWVQGGSMSKIQIFIPDSKGSLLIGVSHPASAVQAPSGATMVTTAGLTGLFGASLIDGLALKAASAGVGSSVSA